MADQRIPDSGEQASGGPTEGNDKPRAIRLAERDIRLAERAVADAKDLGSETALKAARDRLKEARKALQRIRSADPGEDRREARQDFMEDYYSRLGPEAASLARQDPELRKLFDEAIRKGWDDQQFLSELKQTDWWKDPDKGTSWRQAFDLEFNQPPGVWREALEDAKTAIRDLADQMYDMVIPEELLDQIARRYYYQGWAKGDNRGLKVWLDRQFGKQSRDADSGLTPGGQYLETERTLRDAVRGYGLTRDDAWISKTARDVLNPNSGYTADDAWNELIAEAESLYPVFAGKLSKDRTIRDLGAGYINQVYRYLELADPDSVDLSDPLLQRAFTNVGEDGNPSLMPLWRFNQEIKKDDRWQYTTNALSTYSQIGSDMARMMGFVG